MQGARGGLQQKTCARSACSRIFNTFQSRLYCRDFCARKHQEEQAAEARTAQEVRACDRVLALLIKESVPLSSDAISLRLGLPLSRVKSLLKALRAYKQVRLLRTFRGPMYTNQVATPSSEKADGVPEERRTSDPAGEPSNKPPSPPSLQRRATDGVEYEVVWDGSHGALPGHSVRYGLGSSLNPYNNGARVLRNKHRGT